MSDWLLVTLHGYGGDGRSFGEQMDRARPVGSSSPHRFAPDGPVESTFGPGRAWFGLTRRSAVIARHIDHAAYPLAIRIQQRQRETNVGPGRTAVVGFSQGGALAARLLEDGACATAAAVCAPVDWRAIPTRNPIRPTLLCVLGGRDPYLPADTVGPDHSLVTAGVARRELLPELGHDPDAMALTATWLFVRDHMCTGAGERRTA